jgi:hypothetical protein
MSAQTTIAAPARGRRRWLALGAAVLAAGAIGATLAIAFESTREKTASTRPTSVSSPAPSAAADAHRVPSIMSLTPTRLAEGALGTGYALPQAQKGPTLAAVLASMSPETRRYTKAVMSLTFAQLAAGAAGSP